MLDKIVQKIAPFKGMIYFACMLLLTHFAWKYSFTESLSRGGAPQVWLWQWLDCSAFFDTLVDGLCVSIDWVMTNVLQIEGYVLRGHRFYCIEPMRSSVDIVWSCTGMKQLFVFTTMLLCYPFAHRQKLWAVPTFAVVILLINWVRLLLLLLCAKANPYEFEPWHEASKYIVYALLFVLWITWENWALKKDKADATSN